MRCASALISLLGGNGKPCTQVQNWSNRLLKAAILRLGPDGRVYVLPVLIRGGLIRIDAQASRPWLSPPNSGSQSWKIHRIGGCSPRVPRASGQLLGISKAHGDGSGYRVQDPSPLAFFRAFSGPANGFGPAGVAAAFFRRGAGTWPAVARDNRDCPCLNFCRSTSCRTAWPCGSRPAVL